MNEIRMADLHGQYIKIRSEVNEAIQRVIDSTAFIRGEDVRLFEKELAEYLGVPHAITCGNGTDALQVAMMAAGLEPGDEVITSPFTFISTIEVIRLLKLRPVLVDVREDTFNLDPGHLERAYTSHTRAIVPVHLFGQCADMDRIMDFARAIGIYVIEDNAQALGADHTDMEGRIRKAGTIGHIGTTSFFPSKNLGAFGDGGALLTRDESFGNLLGSLVNHGMGRERYYYDHVGVNSRLDTLQAAILRVKLRHLDGYHASRQKAASFYDQALSDIAGLHLPVRSSFSTHIFHQYTLRVDHGRRDALRNWLHDRKVPAMIYYPVPLHLQKAYRDLGYREGDLPVAEALSASVLSLPMHTELEKEQLDHICGAVRAFFNRQK
jgi:dTDP-4-amino-4,6-dideoxygalactose transaminase